MVNGQQTTDTIRRKTIVCSLVDKPEQNPPENVIILT